MHIPIDSAGVWLVVGIGFACFLGLIAPQIVHGSYPPENYLRAYQEHDELIAKVSSLTSFGREHPAAPVGYYSLRTFCRSSGGLEHEAKDMGELLTTKRIEISPYRFKMNVNETNRVLCVVETALDENDVKQFHKKIDDNFLVILALEKYPVKKITEHSSTDELFRWTGYPIGFRYIDEKSGEKYYINNHLKFKIFIADYDEPPIDSGALSGGDGIPKEGAHQEGGYLVVRFDVEPCSVPQIDLKEFHKQYAKVPDIQCENNGLYQEIAMGQKIVYSYEVNFVKSDSNEFQEFVTSDNRSQWDTFLEMVHTSVMADWFLIFIFLVVTSFLGGLVFFIFVRAVFLRTERRAQTKYEELGSEAHSQVIEKLCSWKQVDVDPRHAALLCFMVGDALQMLGTAIMTIIFAPLDFMGSAYDVMVLAGMLVLYLSVGITAGYSASRLWRTLNGEPTGWRSFSWSIACFFPGAAFAFLTGLNSLLLARINQADIGISVFFGWFLMWVNISMPLTLLGGFIGVRAERISYPTSFKCFTLGASFTSNSHPVRRL